MKNRYSLFIFIILLVVSGDVCSQSLTELAKVVASDRAADDRFGSTLATDGDYAIISSPENDFNVTGGDSIANAGAVYIFKRDGNGQWNEVQKIVASDRGQSELFGITVDISGDYIIVGSWNGNDAQGINNMYGAGAAYIFKRDGNGMWTEIQKIVASDRGYNHYFSTVAINGDYAIVGASRNSYNEVGSDSVKWAGAAYIFHKDTNGQWTEVQKIVASDRSVNALFGGSTIDMNGDYAVLGNFHNKTDILGNNSITNAGAAYIFKKDANDVWSEVQKIVASNRAEQNAFGGSVAIDGDFIIAGAHRDGTDVFGGNNIYRAGAAYIFQKDANGYWSEVQKIVASNRGVEDWFGFRVSIEGDYAVIGACLQDTDPAGSNFLLNSGAAYIFQKDANGYWNEVQKVVPSDRTSSGLFGYNVIISGDQVIVGAIGNETDVSGFNNMSLAGAVYFFKLNFPVSSEELLSPKTWTIYPNPVIESFVLEGLSNPQAYQIIDKMGRIVQQGLVHSKQVISVSPLHSGMYYFKLENGEVTSFIKH